MCVRCDRARWREWLRVLHTSTICSLHSIKAFTPRTTCHLMKASKSPRHLSKLSYSHCKLKIEVILLFFGFGSMGFSVKREELNWKWMKRKTLFFSSPAHPSFRPRKSFLKLPTKDFLKLHNNNKVNIDRRKFEVSLDGRRRRRQNNVENL